MSADLTRANGSTTIICARRRPPRKCSLCDWSCRVLCDGLGCNVPLCSRHRWAANDDIDLCPNCVADIKYATRHIAPDQASLF